MVILWVYPMKGSEREDKKMLVKMIYTAEDLRNEFVKMDRDYYSYEGYEAILNLFEEVDCGEPTNLDVIGICGDFNEEEPEDIMNAYNITINEMNWSEAVEELGEDVAMEKLLDQLNYHTWAQDLRNGNIIYQAF